MSVAGIDYSTRFVDVVLLDEDTDAATWHRFELRGSDGFDRARDVARAMPGPLNEFWDEVVAIGIEDPRGFGSGSLYRVQGVILGKLPGARLVQPWIPSAWRKTVGLKGNASKLDIEDFVWLKKQAAIDHLPVGIILPRWPQDACDAYCIALATRMSVQVTA